VDDDGKIAERQATDALPAHERRRGDLVTETERRAHDTDQASLDARRQDTDDNLSTERDGADLSVVALGETKSALSDAQGAQARNKDVLGMVAHDLRSPLAIIAMSAQVIDEETREPATREAAQEVTRAAARMARLLADLLDVARVDSGAFQIAKRRQDVGMLVTEVLNSYRPLFAAREITLLGEPPPAGIVASFDRDRIVQVLSNLLGNAMKFTPVNGIVELGVRGRDQDVELVLRDNGPGISAEAMPNVFKRFWQIDSSARRGLGLGLYICEKIVEAHGGRIWGESTFGQGATFRFTLPLGAIAA
jgi:signal transduction histidine kinase